MTRPTDLGHPARTHNQKEHPAMSDTPDTPQRRPFAAVLQEHRRGGLAVELGDKLAELAAAVVETNKKGTLTLQLTLAPNGQGSVKLGDRVVLKAPSPTMPEAFFYVDEHGNLNRNDPRQPRLPIAADDLDARRGASA
ncbi:hypothetical protein [Paraconexibacter algicola]|uniref:Uncharacterized protein n=1 Tax=Paraconexibacter algicola TaxID=2133960 RepID=A0A2T4UE40_9ACTN|nr:hypothetical protein [Paraconexibacter algicola]PTL55779.1 hypothetical protein C7Y72_19310 [Paraconexibacter algicola]